MKHHIESLEKKSTIAKTSQNSRVSKYFRPFGVIGIRVRRMHRENADRSRNSAAPAWKLAVRTAGVRLAGARGAASSHNREHNNPRILPWTTPRSVPGSGVRPKGRISKEQRKTNDVSMFF